ncbi:hypothetical protein MMC10_008425 [Thelotrema lepadinum]|nr:hypothetical protein [Thelotrema lepadinum]
MSSSQDHPSSSGPSAPDNSSLGSPPNQLGLLKRRANLTHEQFLDYWLHRHVPLAIPWTLAIGVESYIQIHSPRLSAAGKAAREAKGGKDEDNIQIEDFDGAAAMTFFPPNHGSATSVEKDNAAVATTAAKAQSYFDKVIVPDEKNFLPGAARDGVVFVDEWMVEGERLDIVKDGKVSDTVDMGDAWKLWEEWDEGKK